MIKFGQLLLASARFGSEGIFSLRSWSTLQHWKGPLSTTPKSLVIPVTVEQTLTQKSRPTLVPT